MVGFGSALRLSRRKGWEEAYVDYESLKLLLTQIEAVYEESATNAAAADGDGNGNGDGRVFGYGYGYGYGFSGDEQDERSNSSSKKTTSTTNRGRRNISGGGRRRGSRKSRKKRKLDFRDELFVEADSSDAFVSLSDEEEEILSDEEEYGNLHHSNPHMNMNMNMNITDSPLIGNYYDYDGQQQQVSPHRHDHIPIEDDTAHSNDDYSQDYSQRQRQQPSDSERTYENNNSLTPRRNSVLPSNADFNFSYSVPSYGSSDPSVHGSSHHSGVGYRGASGSGTALAGRKGGHEYQQQYRHSPNHNHHQNHNIDHNIDDERHPILSSRSNTRPFALDNFYNQQQQQKQQQQHHHNWQQQLDNQHPQHRGRSDSQDWFGRVGQNSGGNSGGGYGQQINNNMQQSNQNNRGNMNTQQRIRRRRKTRRKRRKRRPNVPRHIRIAHTKSRAITERFLGLLRAEIDKICLFTHSRMGELTDTVGSLRFPFDQTDYDRQEDDHTLGMHPSASSSSDEEPQYLSSSFNEKSIDHHHHHHHDESFMKPPLFPRRRNDGQAAALAACSREEIMSDEETNIQSPAWRHIKIATSLRLARPTFQRSDHILGEDWMLLSAMDEADAYTTTGVEFLHLLKFICVNAIAVRKLCRKHDRLLASRMLGGYYKRLGRNKLGNDAIGGFRSRRNNTKSSLERQRHVLERGQQKLTGVYDSIVLSLANNSVAEDLTESLYLALLEYEVSRQRADALSKLKEPGNLNQSSDDVAEVGEEVTCYHFSRKKKLSSPESRDLSLDEYDEKDKSDDALSTSSSISLTRLRFAMASVISLREATLEKVEPFNQFFSRSTLTLNLDGSHFVGDFHGIQGYSRHALDILLQYNPNFTLLHDAHVLKKSLLIENDGGLRSYSLRNAFNDVQETQDESDESANELSVRSHIPTISRKSSSSHSVIRFLNFSSIALSTMNYYIIVPSAASFCYNLHGRYMHSVLLICAPNLACLITSFFQVFNTIPKIKKIPERVFHRHLAISALFPLLGNVFYTVGYERRSILISLLGRFIVGLSSSDVVNKYIAISQARTNNEISEVALLRKIHLCSVFVALMAGSSLDIRERKVEIHNHLFFVNFETLPSYTMFFAWTLQLLAIVLSPFPRSSEKKEIKWSSVVDPYVDLTGTTSTSENDDDAPNVTTPKPRRHIRSLSDQRNLEYYVRLQRNVSEASHSDSNPDSNPKTVSQTETKKHHNKTMKAILNRTRKLVFHNIALPITMALHIFSNLTIEMIISSCVVITHRYFKWSGSKAGYFLALLTALFIPLNLLAALWSRRYGERSIFKKSLTLMLLGSMVGVNYTSLYDLFCEINGIYHHNEYYAGEKIKQFDWGAGIFQYCISSAIILSAAVLIEGASLNLISKVSPQKLNTSAINCSTLVPCLGCFGKVLGATILIIVGFSHRLIYADMVNSISFFVITLLLLCYYAVKKNYFFLYGSL